MLKLFQFLSMLIVVCLLLTACEETGQSSTGKTVVVTPAIKGNSATLNVGDTLDIQIPTIPTAGYEWEVQDFDTAVLVQEGSAVYSADTSPNSAGGVVTLRFNAVGAGSTSINLLYVNSSSDVALSTSLNSFSMTVEVK